MKTKLLFLFFTVFFFIKSNAQCAMCRAVLETEEGDTLAAGVNDGIVYLMAIPYILVFGVGFFVYFKYFKTKPSDNN